MRKICNLAAPWKHWNQHIRKPVQKCDYLPLQVFPYTVNFCLILCLCLSGSSSGELENYENQREVRVVWHISLRGNKFLSNLYLNLHITVQEMCNTFSVFNKSKNSTFSIFLFTRVTVQEMYNILSVFYESSKVFNILQLVVPASVSDDDLRQVASHRSRSRLPVSTSCIVDTIVQLY